MSWVSARITPAGDRDSVIAAAFGAGSEGIQEEGDALVAHFPPGSTAEGIRSAIHRADARAIIELTDTPDVDWSVSWRDRIVAHRVGALTITPPWLAPGLDPSGTIIIEPQMAFGTGDHATTRGVVRLMQEIVREGDVVADLGAGSAVLSIAAAKLGASRVVAIESDPDAIPNAEENVRINGVQDRVLVLEGDAATLLPLVAPVRVVLANIVSSVLLALLPLIDQALVRGGEAVLSGILLEERMMMGERLATAGWVTLAEHAEDEWWSVRIVRRP